MVGGAGFSSLFFFGEPLVYYVYHVAKGFSSHRIWERFNYFTGYRKRRMDGWVDGLWKGLQSEDAQARGVGVGVKRNFEQDGFKYKSLHMYGLICKSR